MVEIVIQYQGDLSCEAEHAPSGTTLLTDAPKDNHGKGESFSPTDLVATALGSCMLTIMGIAAKKKRISIDGASASVVKEMATAPVRRIGALKVVLTIPGELTEEQKETLRVAALSCPVHKSLHPDVAMPVEFRFA